MSIKQIKSEHDLMAGLEKMMGLKDSVETSAKGIADKLGLAYWSTSLQKKLDILTNTKRISVEKGSRKKMLITLLNPLTTEEKKGLTNVVIFGDNYKESKQAATVEVTEKYDGAMININEAVINETPTNEAVTDEALELKDPTDVTHDIDEIFDDITNKTRHLVSRCKTLEERNLQLELELEISKQRERKWMQRAIEYQSKL
jgi:Zn-dependent M32 family carboxypeptidase